ncbi:hypothetical protein ACRRTK_014672 [Alexandromys fortis]
MEDRKRRESKKMTKRYSPDDTVPTFITPNRSHVLPSPVPPRTLSPAGKPSVQSFGGNK